MIKKEIERKFLVKNTDWLNSKYQIIDIVQAYIDKNTRIRIENDKASITIKDNTNLVTRDEYVYDIPFKEAHRLIFTLYLGQCVEKKRYIIYESDTKWEVDYFEGMNRGLVLAEVELRSEEQHFEHPSWLGKEVTGEKKYYNYYLATSPYKFWKNVHGI